MAQGRFFRLLSSTKAKAKNIPPTISSTPESTTGNMKMSVTSLAAPEMMKSKGIEKLSSVSHDHELYVLTQANLYLQCN